MVETGWLQSMIGLFAAVGSMLLGIGDALVALAGGDAGPSVEIRLRVDMEEPRAPGLPMEETLAVLQARFPEAKVTRVPSDNGMAAEFSVIGKLPGTDEELGELAVATGEFHLRMTATAEDASELGVDLTAEQQRVETYLMRHSVKAIDRYNSLTPEEGGSPARLVFALEEQDGTLTPVPLIIETEKAWHFDETALARVYRTEDRNRNACIGFEIAPERQRDFFHFTDTHEGQQLAVTVGHRILTRPNLNQPLETGGIITGGTFGDSGEWTRSVDRFVRLLSSPRLPVRLRLVSIERRGR
ncbi:hypothetical protein Poly30_43280 [Planctomycetes bacterium Poly30]|uniref:Preprotein translocase subunit SecD n=1 Tax=Saltatorellus ferox TaxID=2528018 RepID=A0A518EXG8_9BACT|nr:hypothetical protein Poly30_43280 [Planctomycetes bacterium Poly30]